MSRRLLTTCCAMGALFLCAASARAETSRVTEREYDLYRVLMKAGLADAPIDMSGLTRFELAAYVGRSIERLKAGAWNDGIADTQKAEALSALQTLIGESRADLQRLNISVKNALALIGQEQRRVGTVVSPSPRGTKVQEAIRPARPTPHAPAEKKMTAQLLAPRSLTLSTSANAVIVGSASHLNLSRGLRGYGLELGGFESGSDAAQFNSRLSDGKLDFATAFSRVRGGGIDNRAARSTLTYTPGVISLSSSFNSSSSNTLANAMAGATLPFRATTFGGDVMVRGPLGLRLGGGLEGIQTPDSDVLGRYSTTVGIEAPGDKLQLSLDLRRSAFFFDQTAAVYSARLGFGYNLSHSVGFQLRYQMQPDYLRTFGQRDGGFSNFVAGQVSVRW